MYQSNFNQPEHPTNIWEKPYNGGAFLSEGWGGV